MSDPGTSAESSSPSVDDSSSLNICPICYDEFSVRVAIQPCNHEFDLHCIERWHQTTTRRLTQCPMCRREITAIGEKAIDDIDISRFQPSYHPFSSFRMANPNLQEHLARSPLSHFLEQLAGFEMLDYEISDELPDLMDDSRTQEQERRRIVEEEALAELEFEHSLIDAQRRLVQTSVRIPDNNLEALRYLHDRQRTYQGEEDEDYPLLRGLQPPRFELDALRRQISDLDMEDTQSSDVPERDSAQASATIRDLSPYQMAIDFQHRNAMANRSADLGEGEVLARNSSHRPRSLSRTSSGSLENNIQEAALEPMHLGSTPIARFSGREVEQTSSTTTERRVLARAQDNDTASAAQNLHGRVRRLQQRLETGIARHSPMNNEVAGAAELGPSGLDPLGFSVPWAAMYTEDTQVYRNNPETRYSPRMLNPLGLTLDFVVPRSSVVGRPVEERATGQILEPAEPAVPGQRSHFQPAQSQQDTDRLESEATDSIE